MLEKYIYFVYTTVLASHLSCSFTQAFSENNFSKYLYIL